MTPAEQAAFFATSIRAGVCEPSEVIDWADREIIRTTKPSDALIELATCRPDDLHRMLSQLQILSQGIDEVVALRLTLPILAARIRDGTVTAERIAQFLFNYLINTSSRGMPEDFWPLYGAEDEFFLAVAENYGTTQTVTQKLLAAMDHAGVTQCEDPKR